MKQRPTREDVAREAGVSKTTVTYVLSDRYDIAIPEATRQRVRMVAQQLRYRPHAAAQALASGRTNCITVALPLEIGQHYMHVLQAFERHTSAHDYQMIASAIGHSGLESVLHDLSALISNLTDGVILVDMPVAFKPYLDQILPSNKPIVSVGVFTVPGIDSVEVAFEKGATVALNHLLDANPRRLAFFGSDSQSLLLKRVFENNRDPRPIAYCRAMAEAGRPVEIIAGEPGKRRASMEALKTYVAHHGCPDALFCFNDVLALSAHRALRDMGYRIPEDVLLVGCDGSDESEYVDPPLSTVAQPVDAMCRLAWEFMANRLNNPDIPKQHAIVATEFIIRQSSQR